MLLGMKDAALQLLLRGSLAGVFDDPAWTAVLVLLTALAVAVSVYVYLKTRSRRSISYRQEITEVGNIQPDAGDKVTISYDGHPVSNVFLVEVTLINSGNEAIRAEDFDEPIKLHFGEAKPMSVDVTDTWPEELEVHLAIAEHEVSLTPLLMNEGDELTFKVLVRDFESVARLRGRIVGIPELNDAKAQEERIQSWRKALLYNSLFVTTAAAAAIALVGGVAGVFAGKTASESQHAIIYLRKGNPGPPSICGDITRRAHGRVFVNLPQGGYTMVHGSEITAVRENSC